MASSALVVGYSGSGKSTSTLNLDPKTTFIISVSGKDLPYSWKKHYTPFSKTNLQGNYLVSCDAEEIVRCMEYIDKKMPHILTIVLDDYIYLASFEFMERALEKGFDKFNIIGRNIFRTATKPRTLREDLTVFYLTHPEEAIDETGKKFTKAKTVGKLVDSALTLEGLFTVVLYAKVRLTKEGPYHYFETMNTGDSTCKSPMGMFEEAEIPNDLESVRKIMQDYYAK